jgi:hypothetical protein
MENLQNFRARFFDRFFAHGIGAQRRWFARGGFQRIEAEVETREQRALAVEQRGVRRALILF